MFSTEIALNKTLEECCEIRAQALAKFKMGVQLIGEAQQLVNTIGESLYVIPDRSDFNFSNADQTTEDARKILDRSMWRYLFDKTGLMQFMDMTAKKEFDEATEYEPPPFTPDTVRATVVEYASKADHLFARGLVTTFRRLSDDHVTNTDEPFKINRRCVISNMFSPRWGGGLEVKTYYGRGDMFNDLDRVMKTLDGKKFNERGLQDEINAHYAAIAPDRDKPFENAYYRIRGFKNSNAHIEFLREDLLEKANKIIAKYYQDENLLAQAKPGKRKRKFDNMEK